MFHTELVGLSQFLKSKLKSRKTYTLLRVLSAVKQLEYWLFPWGICVIQPKSCWHLVPIENVL